MRLAIVLPSSPTLSTVCVERTVPELRRHGWDTQVVYVESNAGHERNWQQFLDDLRRGWDAHPHGELCENGARRSAPENFAPDVVHYAGGWAPSRGVAGARVVVSVDGRNLASTDDPGWEADALLFSEAGLWDGALARGCPPTIPWAVIQPSVHDSFFASPTRPQAGYLRVLTVGALDWAQGYEYAFEAVRLLLDRGVNCRYRVVGDGDFADALRFARYQLGVDRAVELIGRVNLASLKAQLEWADVYLCPALVDGISPALSHAQAMSLPVVTTHGRTPRDVVPDDTGFVVPRRDPQELADKLELLSDMSLRHRLGAAAHAFARTRHVAARNVALLDELYRRVYGAS